jgi:ATP-dependent HslUV protease ATP-binding subunit HslU
MTTVLEDVLFELPDESHEKVVMDLPFVRERLRTILEDEDLRRYIL